MLSSLPKSLVPAALLVALCSTTGSAAADYTKQEVPVPIRDAPDDLSGHFVLAPKLAYLVPMGSAEERFSQRGYIKSGPAFGVDLGYGISRYVALHARFEYGMFGSGDDCPSGRSCEAKTMSFGAGVDYHLVNGAAFDPWMRAGVGYRTMRYELDLSGTQTDAEYSGVEWLHVAVGGDWYAHSMLGFGPYLALDLGSYSNRPDDGVRPNSGPSKSAMHTFLSIGLRGVFDPMR